MAFFLKPEARFEFDDACDYLFARSPDTAIRFASAVQACFDDIRVAGVRHLEPGSVHMRRVKGFPYKVFYTTDNADVIAIVAVAHSAREPGYWRGRL